MSREQKMAWFGVGVSAFALVAAAALFVLVGWVFAWMAVGLCGLGGLAPVVFRKQRKADLVASDERDKMIAQEATLGGAMASYLAFIGACMTAWFVFMFQGRRAITIHILPNIVIGAVIVHFLVRSICILVLYGREPSHAQE